MQLKSVLIVPVILSTLLLNACGEKTAEAPAVTAPAEVAAPVLEAAPAPEPVAGGYVPTAEELVPGITRTKEEQDKINAEALVGIPMPQIPGEAPEPAPAEVAPEAAK